MKVERLNPYENYEDKQRAEKYIMHILNCAGLFEHRMRIKPTVFMSNDVLDIIARFYREKVTSHNFGEVISIFGYDVKMIYAKDALYLGIDINVKGGE